ncbi:hypothetical protein FRC03_012900, partial [Tulasnella sp. 419]
MSESDCDQGVDEEVQVNQRALIEKILARYPTRLTIFRELLQNSDDAGATNAEIRFITQGSPAQSPSALPKIWEKPLSKWVFCNDGRPFSENDWKRLKSIADGNPDEDKIGAFGVGFYSVFSITDEPRVKSGQEWMGFRWKGDQLIASRGNLLKPCSISPSGKPWTSIEMPCREASSIPESPLDIAQFLVMSLTFMTSLRSLSVFVDEHCLAHVQKEYSESTTLQIPQGFITKRPNGMMEIKTVHSCVLTITAQVIQAILQEKEEKNSFGLIKSSIHVTLYSADVEVSASEKITSELKRATKKPPPRVCKLSLIHHEDNRRSQGKHVPIDYVFRNLRGEADSSNSARVFIGHTTSQSTGIGAHVSARFIPTVDRESIDFMDPYVSLWNKELLYVGGFLARMVYERHVASIQESWDQAMQKLASNLVPHHTLLQELEARFGQLLRFFGFHETAPSPMFGDIMKDAFFECREEKSLPILSNKGVKSVYDVRQYDPMLLPFLKNQPMLPESVARASLNMIQILGVRNILRSASFDDILTDLSQSVLIEEEMVACLRWRVLLDAKQIEESQKQMIRDHFLQKVKFLRGNNDPVNGGRITLLKDIRTCVLWNSDIPHDRPLPPHTLPFSIGRNFQERELQSSFGWSSLGVLDWVEYLISPSTLKAVGENDNMTVSAGFAEQVLMVMSGTWLSHPEEHKSKVVDILKDKPVVPTRNGLRPPTKSYFPAADIFEDLSIVMFPIVLDIQESFEQLLESLGVKKHLELPIILRRISETGGWSTEDLVKYLASIRSLLTDADLEELRQKEVFRQEPMSNSGGRTVLSNLHEPLSIFRKLRLPLLEWKAGKWNSDSNEAKLLFEIGLRRHPKLELLINHMADSKENIRKTALEYFLQNFQTQYSTDYQPDNFGNVKYIPAKGQDGTRCLRRPGEVFVNRACSVMGYFVVDSQLSEDASKKLGILNDPPAQNIIDILLESPPTQHDKARAYFEYLAKRSDDFTPDDYRTLGSAPIIPIRLSVAHHKGHNHLVMEKPNECFLKLPPGGVVYAKLFTFVNFGNKAEMFLRSCGVKETPSMHDVVKILLKDPVVFRDIVGSDERYLAQLRQIAINYPTFPNELKSQMRESPMFLGFRDTLIATQNPTPADYGDVDVDDYQYEQRSELLLSSEIVIVDEAIAFTHFRDSIYAAPDDD